MFSDSMQGMINSNSSRILRKLLIQRKQMAGEKWDVRRCFSFVVRDVDMKVNFPLTILVDATSAKPYF